MGWQRVARRAARRAGVSDPEAFVRQMGQEAHGQDLTSPAGAQGPAQITPGTAQAWGLAPSQVHNLHASYRAAAEHVAGYERQFGSLRDAFVAYNAGPGAVGKPPPAETVNYLHVILGGGGGGRPSRPSPSLPAAGQAGGTRPAMFTPTRQVTSQQPVFDQAGYQEAQRRQLLASFLQKQGRGNSVLFRSGLLSSAPVDPTSFQGSQPITRTVRGVPMPVPGGASATPAAAGGLPAGNLNAAVAAARKQLGAITENTGSNRGTRLDKLEQRYGFTGQPWCGIFAGSVLQKAGVRGVGSWIASVAAIEQRARAHAGPFAGWTDGAHARPGDLVIPVQGEHVAVVTAVHNGVIHVIGGNNSNGTVGRATYSAASVHGVARVRY